MKRHILLVGAGCHGFVLQNPWCYKYDGGFAYQGSQDPRQLPCCFISDGAPARHYWSEGVSLVDFGQPIKFWCSCSCWVHLLVKVEIDGPSALNFLSKLINLFLYLLLGLCFIYL